MRINLLALSLTHSLILFANPGHCIPGGCLSCAQPSGDDTSLNGTSPSTGSIAQFSMGGRRGLPPTPPDPRTVPAQGPREKLPGGLLGDRISFVLHDGTGASLETNRYRLSCGARNDELRIALFAAMQALAATVNDFANPPYDFGFPVLFGSSQDTVRHVLTQLSRIGARVPISDRERTIEEKPLLLCATSDMLERYSYSKAYWSACKRQQYWPAYHVEGSHAIIICPSFFNLPTTPSRPLCPPWEASSQRWATTFNAATLDFRAYALLQQLFQMSITADPAAPSYSPPSAWLNWNAQQVLPTSWKERDPSSYLLYAALVHQQCRIRPRPGMPALTFLPRMGLTEEGLVWVGTLPAAGGSPGQSPRGEWTAQMLI